MRFKNALFMSNFGVDMGLPEFRVGSYANYLLPLSKVFNEVSGGSSRYLLGSHTLDLLARKSGVKEINAGNSFVVESSDYAPVFGIGDEFILKSYHDDFGQHIDVYAQYFQSLFKGWVPDIIFCWEFPTNLFRRLFPNALVLDIMPGAFMRPPYPKTISVDPVGLYKNSYLSSVELSRSYEESGDVDEFYKIRDMYASYFDADVDVKKVILDLVDPKREFEKYWLVPMQISGYFGFYENCGYKDQFEFITDVLAKAPKDVGIIATQYIGFISEKALNNRNLGYLRSLHPNLLYSTEFEKLDNLSQYIVPWVDSVVTVSSTLGFQALMFGKKLISPSTSHLSYLSSSLDVQKNMPSDALVASIFCKQNILFDKLIGDKKYFAEVLTSLGNRESDLAHDVLKSFPQLPNLHKEFLALSSFSAANNQVKKMGGMASNKKNSLNSLRGRIDKYEIISFDIFDTLLARTVFKPEDAFSLIQKKLESEHRNLLPPLLVKRFPELRVGFERQLRKEYDETSHGENTAVKEEFYAVDIYHRMLSSFGLDESLAARLLAIEEDVELTLLGPRSLGKQIYDYAVSKGKRVILVSDFTHTKEFVARALSNAGFNRHEALFVSSEIGLKKHSGRLYPYVLSSLNTSAENVLHIGDNSTGDFLRALDSNIMPTKIFSTRERVNQVFRNRGIDPSVFDNSFYLRTAANLYAEEYFDALLVAGDKALDSVKESRDVITSPGEFGFLALGPVMYEFTKWILENALKQGCTKVLFFARDCYLPFEIAKKLVAGVDKYSSLEPIYLAVSRKALTCLNLHTPDDCFKVRLDDFSRNKTLSDLLVSRFKIDTDRVHEIYLEKWNIKHIDALVKETTLGAIYGLVYEYLSADWKYWSECNAPTKVAFKQYLASAGLDASNDVVAVDFGYKGSAHSVVSEYFSAKFIPLFFMTYSSELGGDPYPDGQSFMFKNMNVKYKASTPAIAHNLILETIINEPLGSLASYGIIEGRVELEREELESDQHLSKIRAIHSGALNFSEIWIKRVETLGFEIELESNSALYMLWVFFSNPVRADLEVIKGLIFDNAYAGAENTYILSPRIGHPKDIWQEGAALSQRLSKPASVAATAAAGVKNLTNALVKAAAPKVSMAAGGHNTVRSYKAAKSLHRSQFLQALSRLAYPDKQCSVDEKLIDLVPSKGKNHVARLFLKENGGIWSSRLSLRDKIYLATSEIGKN